MVDVFQFMLCKFVELYYFIVTIIQDVHISGVLDKKVWSQD